MVKIKKKRTPNNRGVGCPFFNGHPTTRWLGVHFYYQDCLVFKREFDPLQVIYLKSKVSFGKILLKKTYLSVYIGSKTCFILKSFHNLSFKKHGQNQQKRMDTQPPGSWVSIFPTRIV